MLVARPTSALKAVFYFETCALYSANLATSGGQRSVDLFVGVEEVRAKEKATTLASFGSLNGC